MGRCGFLALLLGALSCACIAQDSLPANDTKDKQFVVRLSEILIKTPQPYDSVQLSEAQSKAQRIRSDINEGKGFAELAKRYSDGPSARDGGDVGCFAHGSLAPSVEGVLWKMEVGDVTDVTRTKQGFAILEVAGKGNAPDPKSLEFCQLGKNAKPNQLPPELEPWFSTVRDIVKRQWYKLLPRSAFPPTTREGNVAIEIIVRRDGTVSGVWLASTSGYRDLDRAALSAIQKSGPFSAFPENVHVDHMFGRLDFQYNPERTPSQK